MRLAWLTDIHLNFLGTQQIETFLTTVAEHEADQLLITGDIGEAPNVRDYLLRIAERLSVPLYFTLGNHDYYHGSISGVRTIVTRLHNEIEHLHWLPLCDIVPLSDTVAMVGHGAPSDGGYGNFIASPIMLNDYVLIKELAWLPKDELLTKVTLLGQEAGDYLRRVLPLALEQYERVIVALHSPPFQETAWHEGATPDDDNPYLPHFTCKAAGDVLLEAATNFPDKQIQVLCGHTHGSGERQIRPNLHVITGGAEYGYPTVQKVFEF